MPLLNIVCMTVCNGTGAEVYNIVYYFCAQVFRYVLIIELTLIGMW